MVYRFMNCVINKIDYYFVKITEFTSNRRLNYYFY